MKKLTLFIIIVLIVQSTRSQVADSVVIDTNQEMYEFLMTRHQKQKKTGFILLGSGLLAAGVGILIAANDTDWWNDEYSGSQFTAGGSHLFCRGFDCSIFDPVSYSCIWQQEKSTNLCPNRTTPNYRLSPQPFESSSSRGENSVLMHNIILAK